MQLATNPSPNHSMFRRRKNIWYSVRNGNWSDPNTWMSNALDRKNVVSPRTGDDVYINHTVTCDIGSTVGNLYGNGYLSLATSITLTINGDIQITGTVDQTAAGSNLILNGYNNVIVNYNSSNNSTVTYSGAFEQSVLNLGYTNLTIGGTCIKRLISDVVVSGRTTVNYVAQLELGSYNFTTTTSTLNGTLSKISNTGAVNFLGDTTLNASGTSTGTGLPTINFLSNPTFNLSGNITGDCRNGINFGNGTVNVLTNQTWTIYGSAYVPFNTGTASVLIASGKTLTIGAINLGGGYNSGGWINNGSVNGVNSTSTLNINGTYAYANSNVAMATGVFNYNYSGQSCVSINTTMTIPFTSFYDLSVFAGSATLSANTTVSNNLYIQQVSTLELSTYDFSVSGNTTLNTGQLNKSGTGTVNFAAIIYTSSTVDGINFSSNPTVNLSGNISGDVRNGLNFGSGIITVTNNVTWSLTTATSPCALSFNILIASGKTLINAGSGTSTGGIKTTGTITGADSTAIFDNRSVFTYNNATAPMATGKLYCNQGPNTFIYGLAGNQDITTPTDPSSPGYQNLTLNGSGAKRLLGNVSVKGVYTLTGPATLNSNGFSLTNP